MKQVEGSVRLRSCLRRGRRSGRAASNEASPLLRILLVGLRRSFVTHLLAKIRRSTRRFGRSVATPHGALRTPIPVRPLTVAPIGHRPLVAALAFALTCHACAGTPLTQPVVKAAEVTPAPAAPPSVEELKNTTYAGLDERLGPVTLMNGRWTGAPPAAGAASRPIVELADDFRVVGDLDGDHLDDAVVVLTYRPGGTATLSFLAVVTRTGGILRNVATIALGDRVQVRSVRIEAGRLLASAVRAGANDAACCPGELVEWQWTLGDGRLNALGTVRTGRLSLATLAGTAWVLRAWDVTEPAGATPVVSLAYDAGRFTGSSGCNRYFAAVEGGAMPGEVKVGPLAGTRMACPDPPSSVEARFLEQLGGARTFGFMVGRLAISYTRGDGSSGHDAVRREHSTQRAVMCVLIAAGAGHRAATPAGVSRCLGLPAEALAEVGASV